MHTTCFLCCNAPYSSGPVVVPGYWLIFRKRLAFSLPDFHSDSHFVLAIDWIDLFWADLIIVFRGAVLVTAAALAAWSAFSLPSMFLCPGTHSMFMVRVGACSWISSIASRIPSIMYCPDWRFGVSIAWIADWLSVKTYTFLCLSLFL